jgi:hypothetical protein
MGGYGSGFQGRAKKLTHSTPNIRIEHIKHLLKPLAESITLNCKRHFRQATHTFNLSSVKGGYGDRAMFVCPTCKKTCAVLYGVTLVEHPQCRRCSKLNYACQRKDAMHRVEVVLRKEFAKLSNEIPHFLLHAPNPYTLPRPKGMHFKTYMEICDRISRLQIRYARTFVAKLERTMAAFRK